MAAPCTAATNGLSKRISASINRAWGLGPGPGGFLMKSSRSLPAQNESPAPCQRTTRVRSSPAAPSSRSAMVAYMLDVIAFFFSGRFSRTSRMLPKRSTTMSLMTVPSLRNRAARAQGIDFARLEAELLENLLAVLAQGWSAPRRHLRDALHLNRTADRRRQADAGALERNDDVVRLQLWIADHLLRPPHRAERDVDAAEDFVPVRHGLRAKDFVENGSQLRHVRRELGGIGEARIRQEILATHGLRHPAELVLRDDEHGTGPDRRPIHAQRRIRGIPPVVQILECRPAQTGLDRDTRGPDTLGQQRGRDVRPLAGALAAIQRGDDRRVQADRGRIVTAARNRPGRGRAGIARHRQQAAARPVRRDVEAWKAGVRPLLAEARDIRIDQARVPLRHVV